MNIYVVGETGIALEKILPVMAELRTALSEDAIRKQIRRQMADGYEMLAVVDAGQAVAVCGFVTKEKLAWGKHIYIDDLVTVADAQSKGAGHLLLDTVIKLAKERGCASVHLDSGVQRFAAHRFYLRHNFDITSHHFALNL
ncbi:GNAT family N-acetyltransferase [Alteromonas sp. C1M14]|uniref:GNAT family N-acetyltransferase n=1 Tax=Alteromonas sp. C1M14 TaxID=2841567 RepID=UPI001C0A2E74|nr:GNAT family N-acetyltransferase [Alteromonas sp. C1M14]MBU2976977.1 GNAT family N-acetyltransferase [Alteromonas sp. C1M14]